MSSDNLIVEEIRTAIATTFKMLRSAAPRCRRWRAPASPREST
jgi:hypothetical protein